MSEPRFTTVFQFICSRCKQLNEYRQAHGPLVRPHLVSTKCSHCRTLNWLGGIKGTLLPPGVSPESIEDAVLTVSEAGTARPSNKPAD
jgi:phage FluMu protein Com